MNAGRDYGKAKRQAQANADWSGEPRWLSLYNGVWWVSKTPVLDAERVEPTPGKAGVLPERN